MKNLKNIVRILIIILLLGALSLPAASGLTATNGENILDNYTIGDVERTYVLSFNNCVTCVLFCPECWECLDCSSCFGQFLTFSLYNNGWLGCPTELNPGLLGEIRIYILLFGVHEWWGLGSLNIMATVRETGECAFDEGLITVHQIYIAGTGYINYFSHMSTDKITLWEFIDFVVVKCGYTHNVVLHNIYSVEHTVTFNLNGGTYSGNQNLLVQTVLHGNDAQALSADPTRASRTFVGWEPAVDILDVRENRMFTAVWYPAGGGNGGGGSGTGSAAIVPPAEPPASPHPPVSSQPEPPYAGYERPPEPEVPVPVIVVPFLFMIAIAAFCYRKVEETKEK